MPSINPSFEMSVVLKDYNGMPYMNDFVDVFTIFGMGGLPKVFPVGASSIGPFGTGPGQPGLIYPEIYLPANRQLMIDVQQSANGVAGYSLLVNFIAAKIFKGAQ